MMKCIKTISHDQVWGGGSVVIKYKNSQNSGLRIIHDVMFVCVCVCSQVVTWRNGCKSNFATNLLSRTTCGCTTPPTWGTWTLWGTCCRRTTSSSKSSQAIISPHQSQATHCTYMASVLSDRKCSTNCFHYTGFGGCGASFLSGMPLWFEVRQDVGWENRQWQSEVTQRLREEVVFLPSGELGTLGWNHSVSDVNMDTEDREQKFRPLADWNDKEAGQGLVRSNLDVGFRCCHVMSRHWLSM